MKHAAAHLVLLAWPAALLADDPESAPAASSHVSAHISEMIRADLPKYAPRPARAATTTADSVTALTADPDVLEMPKVTVKDERPVKINSLDILTKAARKKKLARDFKDSFTGLNRLLNGFSIPILSPSMAERGRVYHEQQEWAELTGIANAGKDVDPKAAATRRKDAGATQPVETESRPTAGK